MKTDQNSLKAASVLLGATLLFPQTSLAASPQGSGTWISIAIIVLFLGIGLWAFFGTNHDSHRA